MNHMFHGYDMDRTMLRIGAMNMMTHGIDNPFIEYRDSLSDQNGDKDKYTLILANPPFKGSLDAESVSGDLLKVCKTKKNRTVIPGIISADAENRRSLCLHCTRWSFIWVVYGAQGNSKRNRRKPETGSSCFHAVRCI